MKRRVVITGLGVVSACGLGLDALRCGLRSGRTAIRPVEALPHEKLLVKIAGEAAGYDPLAHFEPKRLQLLDRFSQFAVVAAREAVERAGLSLAEPGLAERTAVVLGTGVGGKTTDDEAFRRLYGEGIPRVNPLTIPRLMASAATSQVTMDLGVTGPAFTTTSACASSSHAIGQAYWMVQHGQVEAALTGGSEACITLGTWKAWEAMRVMAPDACRPFSKERRGMVLGEGAAIAVLEPLERAQARGAKIWAEIVGFGMAADAGHIVEPSWVGAARALRCAVADSELAPEQIGYINTHGTGTASNDAAECRAIREVFGPLADRLAVSSTKSLHGHALGASGAIELAASALALREGFLPPTLNYLGADPACDLDCIPNEARSVQVEAALSSSFAFGGLNAVLALRSVG
ncbi:MAG: beta-ketoacyl-ACP synthase II [Acidobacteria bacterium]|nr:beta-ketoacyl-ACP synthase II [Acidobacteriota bacterium]